MSRFVLLLDDFWLDPLLFALSSKEIPPSDGVHFVGYFNTVAYGEFLKINANITMVSCIPFISIKIYK